MFQIHLSRPYNNSIFKQYSHPWIPTVSLRFCSGRLFEETSSNTQWGKAKQMEPMQWCICSGRQFDAAHENTQHSQMNTIIALKSGFPVGQMS